MAAEQFVLDRLPANNVLDVRSYRMASSPTAKTNALADAYSPGAGFAGVFMADKGQPGYDDQTREAKEIGNYFRDKFHAEAPSGHPTWLGEVAGGLRSGDGGCRMNHRAALEVYFKSGKKGVEPFSTAQDYGSCVDASWSELVCALLGIRAADPQYREVWKSSASWYAYALRGFCSDGWNSFACATASRKIGIALRCVYELAGLSVDLTDDDRSENTMARTWCRNGPPQVMRDYTLANNPWEPGAIVEFEGSLKELKDCFASDGVLHFSGTRQSGGSKPFTPGSVGPHQLGAYGYDDSDEGRKFFQDVVGYKLDSDDFAVHCGQTWGPGWSGECADKYWPPHWGPKTQGSWICSAKWFLKNLSLDTVLFPKLKGVPGDPLPPTPTPSPALVGTLYGETIPSGKIAIRGELSLPIGGTDYRYIVVPDGNGAYKPVPKVM